MALKTKPDTGEVKRRAKAVGKKPMPGESGTALPPELEERRRALVKRRNEILREAKEQISDSISGDTRQLVETALDEGDFAEIIVQEDVNLQRLSTYRN